MIEYEYGIWNIVANKAHRSGMTKEEAEGWLDSFERCVEGMLYGGRPIFKIVKRPLNGWQDA